MTAVQTALVTALPPSRAPGAVPTGPVARHLARRLLRAGLHVRVLAPGPELGGWPAGVEIVEGAITHPAACPAAFRDLDYLSLAGLVSMVPETLRDLTNLALRGGMRRAIVLTSHGSDFEHEYSPATWQWLAFEQALEKHGAEWTYLRTTGLFANALVGGYPVTGSSWAEYVRRGETIREFLPRAPYPFIHEDDVAAVMTAILLNGGRHRQVIDISGTLTSAGERLRRIGEGLGREVRLEELTSSEAAREFWARQGWPEATIDVTLYAISAFAASAHTDMPLIRAQEKTAQSILRRRPRSFADWLADAITAFT